jgi:pre-mRNA-splicing factor 18
MDFASLMSSQIAASKPKSGDAEKKYLKRSEVEAERERKYLQEQEEAEKARQERLEKKRKRDEEEAEQNRVREEKKRKLAEESKKRAEEEREQEERARRKRLCLPELPEKNGNDDSNEGTLLQDGEEDISEDELLSKLKDLGEPRILFGETHAQRLKRYHKLTSQSLAPTLSKGPIPTTLALLPEADMKVPSTIPSDAAGQKYLHRQIASYFDMLLSEWQIALSKRPAEVKDSFSGRQAANNFETAKSNLTPLFRKLESTTLSPALLRSITEIVDLIQQRRYVHANDAYLRLSIGKAAWPIGVTMVGIHERSAREKLHESEKGSEAHIMADEVTRKMLQGIKRCLSFAQTRWPPEDLGQIMG